MSAFLAADPLDAASLIYAHEQKVIATGAEGDSFSLSVSLSGDTALIGAPYDDVGANDWQGSAYVFVRSGDIWTFQQQLTAPDGAASDQFGSSVSLSGDTALIGTSQSPGSAYVFVRSGDTWTFQQQLTAPGGAEFDLFGSSVSLSGDTAIVGAPNDDAGGNTGQGSAYIFVRSGDTWTFQQQLPAPDGAAYDHFGDAVSLSGDTALVGAYGDDVGTSINQGSAYVFVRNGATWTFRQQLTAPGGTVDDHFGDSLSLSGDTVLVGAYVDDVGANLDQGSAYVFVRTGDTWALQQQLIAPGGAAHDQFGSSVSLSGDTALVGAPIDDVGANPDQGAAYVFVRTGDTWTFRQQLIASDGAVGDLFGSSVSLSGDTALVGAPFDDVGANTAQGSAYFYRAIALPYSVYLPKVVTTGS